MRSISTWWAGPVAALGLLGAGCHAHQAASDTATMKSPPEQPQVQSARPVRTTPGAMLDGTSMKKVQAALARHGQSVGQSGTLDDKTEAALRAFQQKHGMAATGLPDFETLRRLGLDPQDIYLGGVQRREARRDGGTSDSRERKDDKK